MHLIPRPSKGKAGKILLVLCKGLVGGGRGLKNLTMEWGGVLQSFLAMCV